MIHFLTSFVIVFLAEIADKTMLITLSLSAKIKRLNLILGVFLASTIVMLIPALVGNWLTTILPRSSLILASGLLFLTIGIFFLLEKDEKEKEKTFKLPEILTVFIVFFISEMGDKTQIATLSISMNTREFLGVWLGATLGIFIPNLVVAIIGSKTLTKINEKVIKYLVSGLFIVIGIITLLEYFGIVQW